MPLRGRGLNLKTPDKMSEPEYFNNEHNIKFTEQDGQVRALEVVAVAAAGRRRGRGDGGDSGVRDHAVQGADRGGRRMVLPAAPLLAAGDCGGDDLVSRVMRDALARGALAGPIGDGGAARFVAGRPMVLAAELFRVGVQSAAERRLRARRRSRLCRRQ